MKVLEGSLFLNQISPMEDLEDSTIRKQGLSMEDLDSSHTCKQTLLLEHSANFAIHNIVLSMRNLK